MHGYDLERHNIYLYKIYSGVPILINKFTVCVQVIVYKPGYTIHCLQSCMNGINYCIPTVLRGAFCTIILYS
jgi:hypothetical protein